MREASRQTRRKFPATVRLGTSRGCWKMYEQGCMGSISPEKGRMPASIFKRVVLPQPLAPRMQAIFPSSMEREKFS